METVPEIFKDKASTWYRHNRKQCTSWNSFKAGLLKFFYLPRYLIGLEGEMCSRIQRTNESFEDYALPLQNLIRGTNQPISQDRLSEQSDTLTHNKGNNMAYNLQEESTIQGMASMFCIEPRCANIKPIPPAALEILAHWSIAFIIPSMESSGIVSKTQDDNCGRMVAAPNKVGEA
uniref:Retrotransposon gag domain-containing protein n=1 Tax=Glossina pallidipes TaxID=7398 RepID=A0A1A9ZDQ2_GLOPL